QEDTSCAVRSDGTAWCWGRNGDGQVGDGTTIDRPSPTQVMASPGVPLANVVEIEAGEFHTCARTIDASLWCWGYNMDNELGDGTAVSSVYPVHVLTAPSTPLQNIRGLHSGSGHVVAWGPAGQLFGWGQGAQGKLGKGSTTNEPFARQLLVADV